MSDEQRDLILRGEQNAARQHARQDAESSAEVTRLRAVIEERAEKDAEDMQRLQRYCDGLFREANALRTDMARADEHIGALVGAVDNLRYTAPIGYVAVTAEYAELEDAVIAARAFLRRREGR